MLQLFIFNFLLWKNFKLRGKWQESHKEPHIAFDQKVPCLKGVLHSQGPSYTGSRAASSCQDTSLPGFPLNRHSSATCEGGRPVISQKRPSPWLADVSSRSHHGCAFLEGTTQGDTLSSERCLGARGVCPSFGEALMAPVAFPL